jgi:hypothetical protein
MSKTQSTKFKKTKINSTKNVPAVFILINAASAKEENTRRVSWSTFESPTSLIA